MGSAVKPMKSFLENLTESEGRTNFMYLDTTGNVTCGVGHLIYSAKEAGQIFDTGATAELEWNTVKSAPRGMVADRYAPLTTSRLSDEQIDALVDSDAESSKSHLTAILPLYRVLPEPAQLGLLDMAFNCGPTRLVNGFPKMIAALKAGNWKLAAAESHRPQVSASRNEWTANWILACADLPVKV